MYGRSWSIEDGAFSFWHYQQGGLSCKSSLLSYNSSAKEGTHLRMGKLILMEMMKTNRFSRATFSTLQECGGKRAEKQMLRPPTDFTLC